MENEFVYLDTRRGHVLVSASLLQPSTESTGGSLTYPDCGLLQDQIPPKAGHGMNMATSRRPLPDFWEHHSQSEALINTVYGPDYLPSPPPPPATRPPLKSVKPLSAQPREPFSSTYSPSPTYSDSAKTEVQYLQELQHAQLLAVSIHMFFQPSWSSGDEQAPTRRRLSPSTPLAQDVYDTPGASGGLSSWLT
ncbi:hypothetical protein E4U43_002168 [Claviceps pusilla]|uniref:Uncharacterized protein n=1 Tax=Claviceps pusilla TaxID=123648 RepID=A0A9P7N6P0_9HYPO|nr:hypothetical protein E4U43_002168 [Claviceps pusilla]